ncbi:hypothetical protein Pcac1_g28699 [Phytophthora cactorum]|nr:hypothetical protein Pcac1_g28699 [Phytophthora cactorum]
MIREDKPVVHQDDEEPVNHGRRHQHIDIKYHHIRDEVKRGEVKLQYLRDFRDAGGHHDEGARGTTPHGPHGGSRHSWDFALRGRIESYRFGIGY